MIYLFTIAILVFLIIKYDLSPYQKGKDYEWWYRIVLIWFICVSGFAYNVGGDIPRYMYEYDFSTWSTLGSWKNIFIDNERRMPGWILTETICNGISKDFFFFKMVIAIFTNTMIFRFIKKQSNYIFTSILFYALILYLNLNFNALRQMIAISFFLYGYDYLIEKKWIRYYLFVVIAYLFHPSAAICAFFPLFLFFPFGKQSILISVAIVLGTSIIAFTTNVNTILSLYLVQSDGISNESVNYAQNYLLEDNVSGLNIKGVMIVFFQVLLYLYILSFLLRSKESVKESNTMYLLFILFFILNYAVPVFFFRLLFYLQFFYIALLPKGIMSFCTTKNFNQKYYILVLIILFCYVPISNLFQVNKKTDYPLFVQYYPYHSIFDKEIDPVRNSLFGWHE